MLAHEKNAETGRRGDAENYITLAVMILAVILFSLRLSLIHPLPRRLRISLSLRFFLKVP